ncbi:hypothetical protein LZ31DRAFT_22350 [Colletotrichum somersetense]|nr:hypothetical protein LZ31DRAFT_22350 [Colletotrichum somersetense]
MPPVVLSSFQIPPPTRSVYVSFVAILTFQFPSCSLSPSGTLLAWPALSTCSPPAASVTGRAPLPLTSPPAPTNQLHITSLPPLLFRYLPGRAAALLLRASSPVFRCSSRAHLSKRRIGKLQYAACNLATSQPPPPPPATPTELRPSTR